MCLGMVFFRQAGHVEDAWDLVEQVFTLCFRVTYVFIYGLLTWLSGRVCLPVKETQEMGVQSLSR